MADKPWYDKGLRFRCTACGNCCRNHGEYTHVYLAPKDVSAIARHLELTPRAFLRRYCKAEGGWVLLKMDEPACPFLQADNKCAIYPVRPKQCATWPFWTENLAEKTWKGPVKADCPGIDQGELHSREEIERIARETDEWYEE